MAERGRIRLRLIPLLLLPLLGVGCATGLMGGSEAETAEIRRLRERVAQLEREARVQEVEIRRLRAALDAGEATAAAATEAPPSRQGPAVEAPEVAETRTIPPRAEPGIEEDDLAMDPVEGAPAPTTPAETGAPEERTATLPAPAEAQAVYDEAYSLFHQGMYEEAETLFSRYLDRYATTRLADNAQFWIGECRYARGDHEGALRAFLRTVERFPEGNKVPDAMVKAGKCLESLGDLDGARQTYREVRRSHPGTAAAAIAEERLLMLR